MIDRTKLRCCPYCGAEPRVTERPNNFEMWTMIFCAECNGKYVAAETYEEAAAVWNDDE